MKVGLSRICLPDSRLDIPPSLVSAEDYIMYASWYELLKKVGGRKYFLIVTEH